MQKNFTKSVDQNRPHTCLTADPKNSGQLEYRYDDTGETVVVPNVWYNQSFRTRANVMVWDAERYIQSAIEVESDTKSILSQQARNQIGARIREQARETLEK